MNEITLKINGRPVTAQVDGNTRLLDFVRNQQGLTGTKEGCGIGECGACTLIMNGRTVCSCMTLAAQCDGAEICTIESLAEDSVGRALQDAFVEEGGVQCGFCTPGVLLSAKALLDRDPKPDDAAVKDALEGNLCRCTGYQPILRSIERVTQD